MTKKILVLLGHPDTKSYCASVADAYIKGAKSTGAKIKYTQVGKLKFDPVLKNMNHAQKPLEKDLQQVQKDMKWANHYVIIYPVWWGTMPALLKGFFDRVLLPGFAYNFKGPGKWDKLLKGKSAHLIITMGAPAFAGKLFMNQGTSLIKKLILNFCGVSPIKVTRLGKLMMENMEPTLKKYLIKIEKMGQKQL